MDKKVFMNGVEISYVEPYGIDIPPPANITHVITDVTEGMTIQLQDYALIRDVHNKKVTLKIDIAYTLLSNEKQDV